jgi:DNA-binding CsgD family transcriptional regulator
MPKASQDEQLAGRMLERLSASSDAATALRRFGETASEAGLPAVIYGHAPGAYGSDGRWTVPTILTHNVPGDWAENVQNVRWADPYFHACFRPTPAVDWRIVQADGGLSPESRRFLTGVSDHGLTQGLTIPMHLPRGAISFCTYLGPQSDRTFFEILRRRRSLLFLLAYNLLGTMHARFLPQSAGGARPMLARRELECLNWSALGKSAAETGTILGISSETVRVHLKRSYAKLNASNRCAATAKAMQLGLIEVPTN